MACTCSAITNLTTPCAPAIGGIKTAQFSPGNWIATGIILKTNQDYEGNPVAAKDLVSGTVYYKAASTQAVIDADYRIGTFVECDILPESSSFNAVMTYDKTKGLKYWTTDLTLNIGKFYSEASPNIGSREFADQLACRGGWTIKLITYDEAGNASPKAITINDAFVQTATFNSGTLKSDGQTGTIVLQAITKDAPTIATA